MEPSFGLRRPPDLRPDEPLPDDDPELARRIRSEIERDGPIPFARFMEVVLYDPEHGYYAGPAPRAGRAGDFLTAPESHPIFGWAIARQLDEVWHRLGGPGRFVLREHGAGSGALAEAILDGLRREGSGLAAAIRCQAVETSPARAAAVEARLGKAGLGPAVEPATTEPIVGVTLANELLDALPVHRIEGGPGGELLEVFVGLDPGGAFVDRVGEPSTPELARRLAGEGVELAPGQRAEVCLVLDGWIETVAAQLERGVLLLIDYGYPARDLYDSRARPTGTLRAYVRHRVHADPYRHLGRQDLTAHVDLTAVERVAVRAGLDPIGSTTQAEFLAALDVGELLAGVATEPGASITAALEARSAVRRMLDPAVTGAFRVLAFGRGVDAEPPLRGFGLRLARSGR
jgi:SAM-dependent MidA family methyltransferase